MQVSSYRSTSHPFGAVKNRCGPHPGASPPGPKKERAAICPRKSPKASEKATYFPGKTCGTLHLRLPNHIPSNSQWLRYEDNYLYIRTRSIYASPRYAAHHSSRPRDIWRWLNGTLTIWMSIPSSSTSVIRNSARPFSRKIRKSRCSTRSSPPMPSCGPSSISTAHYRQLMHDFHIDSG